MHELTVYCDTAAFADYLFSALPSARIEPVASHLPGDAGGLAVLARRAGPGVGHEPVALVAGPGGDLLMAALRAVGCAAVPAESSPDQGPLTLTLAADGGEVDPQIEQALDGVARWWRARGDRRITLASPRAACAGVDRAVDIVEQTLARFGPPVYVRKQIVHNEHVVADLASRGARFVEELDEIPDGEVVIFSAHGVAQEVRTEAARRRLTAIDATCPLVAKVHSEVRHHVNDNKTVVYIGHADHEESEGTLGEVPGALRLVETMEDARNLEVPDPDQVAYVTQTTLAVDEVAGIVSELHQRFPGLTGPRGEDICYATTNRQEAVRAVAARVELMVVVGSARSSNAQRLVEVAIRTGSPAVLVEDASELDPALLHDITHIGITAAASTPESWVVSVVDALGSLGEVHVDEIAVAQENVTFTLPALFRQPGQATTSRQPNVTSVGRTRHDRATNPETLPEQLKGIRHE